MELFRHKKSAFQYCNLSRYWYTREDCKKECALYITIQDAIPIAHSFHLNYQFNSRTDTWSRRKFIFYIQILFIKLKPPMVVPNNNLTAMKMRTSLLFSLINFRFQAQNPPAYHLRGTRIHHSSPCI